MSRTIAGTFLLPDGSPLANAKIYLEAKRTEALSILDGVSTFFSTNSSGIYSQSVVNGFYAVSVEVQIDASINGYRRWLLGDIVVEDGANTTLQALLIATNPPADVALTVFYEILADTQAARDAAVAAAEAAAESAASFTVGTTAGTVAAGNDSRITGAAQKSANLSDLTNAGTARGNLGLGSAAVAVVTTSASDATAGRVLKTGDGGINAYTVDIPVSPGLNSWEAGGIWRLLSADAASPNGGVGYVIHGQRNVAYNFDVAIQDTGGFYSRTKNNGVQQAWKQHWTSANLVSPATTDTAQSITALKTHTQGIKVGNSVQADTSVLSFYEERGTFTPIVLGSTTAGVGTYTTQVGGYTRIGNRIDGYVNLAWTAHTGAGDLKIGAFPLATVAGRFQISAPYYYGLTVGAGKELRGQFAGASTEMQLRACDPSGGPDSVVAMDSAVVALRFNFTIFLS